VHKILILFVVSMFNLGLQLNKAFADATPSATVLSAIKALQQDDAGGFISLFSQISLCQIRTLPISTKRRSSVASLIQSPGVSPQKLATALQEDYDWETRYGEWQILGLAFSDGGKSLKADDLPAARPCSLVQERESGFQTVCV
jgi:hypothetical protein